MAIITTRLTTGAAAGSGTITTNTASTTVTGSGTLFTTEAQYAGKALFTSADVFIGTISSITNNTTIVLTANAAVAVSGGSYKIGYQPKNTPLSNAEIDSNFINLNNNKLENSDATSSNVANSVVKRDASGNFTAGALTVTSVTTGSVTYPTANATQAQMEAGTDTTTRYMSPQNVKQAIDTLALSSIGTVTRDMTGFESKATSSLAFIPSTRVFTLTPSGTCYVWKYGKRYTVSSAQSVTLPNTSGGYWIILNPDTMALTSQTTAPDFTADVVVSYVYLDAVNARTVICADERHSSARDTTWHNAQHYNTGTIWRSGGAISYTPNNDSSTSITISTPLVIADEDLEHTITHNPVPSGYFQQILSGAAAIPTLYLSGTTYVTTTESTTPWVAGTSTARYNVVSGGSGVLSDAPNNSFINYWIIATNDTVRPIKAVMGRNSYTTESAAYSESLVDYGLGFPEYAIMYQVVLQTNTAYAGNKVRIVNVRTMPTSSATSNLDNGATSHNRLANLTSTDDHTQYVHLSVARTITAGHTFSGNNTFQGTQAFATLTMSNVGSHMIPTAASTYDLGSTTAAWRHVYTSDLHLSNEKHESGNVVDGTRGNWTIQEGSDVLYIINNKNGKRYKFSLEEV